MCLTVKKPVKILVKKCYKQMRLSTKSFVTPYQDYSPTFQGLFLPITKPLMVLKDPYKDQSINGGFIHAYTYSDKDVADRKTEITSDMHYGQRVFLKAYAFWTVAIGYNNDLVCKALYVPQLDLTNRRNTRVSMLENRYNKDRLIKEFNLGDILGDY